MTISDFLRTPNRVVLEPILCDLEKYSVLGTERD